MLNDCFDHCYSYFITVPFMICCPGSFIKSSVLFNKEFL